MSPVQPVNVFGNFDSLDDIVHLEHQLQDEIAAVSASFQVQWPDASTSFPELSVKQDQKSAASSVTHKTCETCNKVFKTLKGFQRHTTRGHAPKVKGQSPNSDLKLYICSKCDMTFQSTKSMSHHKRAHAPPAWTCKCGKEFKYQKKFQAHNAKCS